jgi:hypothetical protein
MMKAYDKEIEMYLVQEFVSENKRSPTEEELVETRKAFDKKNPNAVCEHNVQAH